MKVHRHIGFDYSGAQTPESRLKARQVYEATRDDKTEKVSAPVEGAKNGAGEYPVLSLSAGLQ